MRLTQSSIKMSGSNEEKGFVLADVVPLLVMRKLLISMLKKASPN